MLSRRSLLGSLAKSLMAAGVIAAPLATVMAPLNVEAQEPPAAEPPAAPKAPKHVTVRRRRRRPFRRRHSDRPPLQGSH
jgi:hypothetical protein